MKPRFIVAEIVKVWQGQEGDGDLISKRFELVISRNLKRGYRLHSWKMSGHSDAPGTLTETIVAVFELSAVVGLMEAL